MMRGALAMAVVLALVACKEDPDEGEQDAAATADGGGAGGGGGPDASVCPRGVTHDACGICGGPGPRTFYPDVDGDGLGDDRLPVQVCLAPARFVDNGDDREPECATNDTDECGACGGPGRITWFLDADGDGQGDELFAIDSCVAPLGYVAEAGDPDPNCFTNDTDPCGTCGGNGSRELYADHDGDGLGDPAESIPGCEEVPGYVGNADDAEPACATNDTDECGLCAGPGYITAYADVDRDGLGDPNQVLEVCFLLEGLVDNADDQEPACATNDTDSCGVCGGGERDQDCNGVCNGEARRDGCGVCSGGDTGIEPQLADVDGDRIPDACDDCPAPQNAMLVVQWQDVPHFDRQGGGPYTFQIILWQSGEFRFQYRDMEPFSASATVGYQLSPDEANLIARDNDFPVQHPAVHVRPLENGRYEADYFVEPQWFEISEIGEPLNLPDDGTARVDLTFPFPLREALYDQVTVSANGLVVIDGGVPDYNNGGLPTDRSRAFLAALWDDLNPGAGGEVLWYIATPACENDCNGVLGGFAVVDACGLCVGGDTGRRPSENVDCNGDCDGEAFLNNCNECVGGNTGRPGDPVGDCRPDLLVDEEYLRRTLLLDYMDVDDPCLIQERCVQDVGRRKLLRFGTRIANVGSADLQLGAPREGVDHWIWGECHQHFHYEAYASYDLYDPRADAVLPIGAKSGFAVIDIGVWDPALAPNGCRGYNGQNQGITAGCQDTYSRDLQCQWIDITDVPDGEYEVIITTNPEQQIPEVSFENNSARARVRITGDRLELLD